MSNISLSRNEKKALLRILDKAKSIEEISKETGLSIDQARSALERLYAKGLVEKKIKETTIVRLKKENQEYRKIGLPEKRLLELLKEKPLSIKEINKLFGREATPAIGALKRKAAIEIIEEGGIKKVKIIRNPEEIRIIEQEFIEKLPIELEKIKDLDLLAYKNLEKRKIIELETRKEYYYLGNKKAKRIVETEEFNKEYEEKLTPEMLRYGTWRNKEFRPYEIHSPVKKARVGRHHLLRVFIRKIREILLSLGFEEMQGPIINPEFWNFDALFVPQDHPAREMQDTFYLDMYTSNIDEAIFKKVDKMHRKGLGKGKGWGIPLDKDKSRRLLPRTHTTVLSARTLNKLDLSTLPRKFFAIGRVYRNESLDWKHLFDLHQIEGIVVGENLSLKHLIGYLKEIYKKLGYDKIKVKPSFFPFTEPSAEVYVYVKEKDQWIELGGSGILRPEVTKPLLGKSIPVLAWGLGLERIIMLKEGIRDIRKIYEPELGEAMYREIKWQ